MLSTCELCMHVQHAFVSYLADSEYEIMAEGDPATCAVAPACGDDEEATQG